MTDHTGWNNIHAMAYYILTRNISRHLWISVKSQTNLTKNFTSTSNIPTLQHTLRLRPLSPVQIYRATCYYSINNFKTTINYGDQKTKVFYTILSRDFRQKSIQLLTPLAWDKSENIIRWLAVSDVWINMFKKSLTGFKCSLKKNREIKYSNQINRIAIEISLLKRAINNNNNNDVNSTVSVWDSLSQYDSIEPPSQGRCSDYDVNVGIIIFQILCFFRCYNNNTPRHPTYGTVKR